MIYPGLISIMFRHLSPSEIVKPTSYGSYYEAGESVAEGLSFEAVLETAMALNVPIIRIWAGRVASHEANTKYRKSVISDTIRIADLAAKVNIKLAFEFHSQTLADTYESALGLLKEVARKNLRMYWQPPLGLSPHLCLKGLMALLPWLTNIHVFQWDSKETRYPLVEGIEVWSKYLRMVSTTGRDHYAMLDYVAQDESENFYNDAETLKNWIHSLG